MGQPITTRIETTTAIITQTKLLLVLPSEVIIILGLQLMQGLIFGSSENIGSLVRLLALILGGILSPKLGIFERSVVLLSH